MLCACFILVIPFAHNEASFSAFHTPVGRSSESCTSCFTVPLISLSLRGTPYALLHPRVYYLSSISRDMAGAQAVEITVQATGRKIKIPTGLFINNEFVPSVDSKETIK